MRKSDPLMWSDCGGGLACYILLQAGTSICLRYGLRELGPQEGITEGGELDIQPRSAE